MTIKNEQGGITVNILLIIMLIVIGVLIYILAGGTVPRIGKIGGVTSPTTMPDEQQLFTTSGGEFTDGLVNPGFSQEYQLDEFGTGVAQRDIFDIDINGDGARDRITRTRNENGTADGFRTTEGAECALTKFQFKFQPEFRVIKISRQWQDSWDTPTMATRTIYSLAGTELAPGKPQQLKSVCDVTDLF